MVAGDITGHHNILRYIPYILKIAWQQSSKFYTDLRIDSSLELTKVLMSTVAIGFDTNVAIL